MKTRSKHENLSGCPDFVSKLGGDVSGILERLLATPIDDLLNRPAKGLRGHLVRIAFELSDGILSQVPEVPYAKYLKGFSSVLELVHAGSLIIDDIEDQSTARRGAPTLHRKYGLSVALNAGNFLYFWPLYQVRLLGLPPAVELRVHREYESALIKAHLGQGLDVGVRVDELLQAEVKDLCLACLEFKSGSLMSLAFVLGAIAAGASEGRIELLRDFGMRLGVSLQMFDDLGNFSGRRDPQKHWEDLKLRRPTWIWASAAELLRPNEYHEFTECVARLPVKADLVHWIGAHHEFYLKGQNPGGGIFGSGHHRIRCGVGRRFGKRF